DDGAATVALDHELVDVPGFGRIHAVDRKVVEDQQIHGDQPAHLRLVGAVEPAGLEALQQPVTPRHDHGVATAAGDVAERGCGMCFAHTNGPQNQEVIPGFDEAQAEELAPQLAVVGDGRGLVPGL